MVGDVSSGGTSSGWLARAWVLYESPDLKTLRIEQPEASASTAGRTRSVERFMREDPSLIDAARFAKRRGERFVVGRGQRREGKPDAFGDPSHAPKGPLDRDGFGFEEEVAVQPEQPVVDRDRLGRLARARRLAHLAHEARGDVGGDRDH